MNLRLAQPHEAEVLWDVRNQAIRAGCRTSYDAEVIARWTPEVMPEGYRHAVAENPFYVIENETGDVLATGYLDLSAGSVEAIFTLPQAEGKGLATRILNAIVNDARQRGFRRLTLSATPNAHAFYQRLGFHTLGENKYPSALAGAELRCFDMAIDLVCEE